MFGAFGEAGFAAAPTAASTAQVQDGTALLSGFTWWGSNATLRPAIVTYSFSAVASSYLDSDRYSAAYKASFRPFDTNDQNVARTAIEAWGRASGLVFIEVVPGSGDIQFGRYDFDRGGPWTSAQAAGYAAYPNMRLTETWSSNSSESGDVFIHIGVPATFSLFAHEIGHALGLKHPHEGDIRLSPNVDTQSATVMSYNFERVPPTSLGRFDVDAVQRLYGIQAQDGSHVASFQFDAQRQLLTQVGTEAADVLRGVFGLDRIDGRAGNDLIFGDNGADQILGGDGLDTLFGGDGNDVITGGPGNDTISGGDGTDYAAFGGVRASFTTVLFGPDTNGDRRPFTVTNISGLEGIDTFSYGDVERLHFVDGVLAFDVSGNAGQGYRLYQASFARTPDGPGLTYWIRRLDEGTQLRDAGAFFATSPEFTQRYGPLANTQFVEQLYQNVLGRRGEAGGVSFWTGELGRGTSRGDVLVGFSESFENKQLVGQAVSSGIWLGLDLIA